MRAVIFILCLIFSVGAILGCIVVDSYGFIMSPLKNEEIAANTDINRIAKQYTGLTAKEIINSEIEDSIFRWVAKFSNWYSKKNAERIWKNNPDKFIKIYESRLKYYAKLGTDNFARVVVYGFWGAGFLTIVITLLHFAFTQDEGMGYFITSMGEIAKDTGGDLIGTIATIIIVVALASLVAPAITFLSLIVSGFFLFEDFF